MRSFLSKAAGAYSAVSSTVGAVTHPVRSAQSAIRGYVVEKVVGAVLQLAGADVANALTRHVQAEKPFHLSLRIPERARGLVLDADTLGMLAGLANDALAAPLTAVGLRVGEITFAPDAAGETLVIDGIFKLTEIQPAPVLPVRIGHD